VPPGEINLAVKWLNNICTKIASKVYPNAAELAKVTLGIEELSELAKPQNPKFLYTVRYHLPGPTLIMEFPTW